MSNYRMAQPGIAEYNFLEVYDYILRNYNSEPVDLSEFKYLLEEYLYYRVSARIILRQEYDSFNVEIFPSLSGTYTLPDYSQIAILLDGALFIPAIELIIERNSTGDWTGSYIENPTPSTASPKMGLVEAMKARIKR